MSFSGNNNYSSSRKGKGRQRVDMVKIKNETNLQVTFSKRCAGLFKKTSELSTLCGAETAVVVFSPGNKAHFFGHPNVDAVTNRFLNLNAPTMSDADKLLEVHQKANISQQNLELNQLQHQLELEQKRAHELERVRREGQRKLLCRSDIDKLDYQKLDQLKDALLLFKHQLETKVHNAGASAPPNLPGQAPNLGTMEFFPSSPNFGKMEKLVPNGRSARVRLDDGASSSNASVRIDPRANSSDVKVFGDGTVRYDPRAGDSSLTIPYTSTAIASSVDPNEH